jgi:hypothetical protein
MDIGDFVKQIPLPLLLMPIVLGGLYIFLMVWIMRRSRKRARARKEALLAAMGGTLPPQRTKPQQSKRGMLDRVGVGDFVRGQLPDRPIEPASWTIPAELRSIPEPDLDMLSIPTSISEMQAQPASNSATPQVQPYKSVFAAENANQQPIESYAEAATVQSSTDHDWLSAVTPEASQQSDQEELADMSVPTSQNNPYGNASMEVGDAVEVMRVYRDLSDGKLIIQLGDGRYRALSDIKNADLARRFSALVRELWTMINGGGGAPAASTGTYTTVNEAVSATDPGIAKRMGLLNAAQPEQKPLNQTFLKGLGRPAQPAPKDESVPGIAGAVEDFLQFKLSGSPQFAARSIHIRPTHDSGVRIEVDGRSYESISDVIDADVREFLSSMMREWEARH